MKHATDETDLFEKDLSELIAAAFGHGVVVEGAWQVTVPVSGTPTWTVTIKREDPTGETGYTPEFLE
ncbi:hypothetical protein [Natronolimnohabitans innermongolicus]|uniref:Uncharacterized protein n=1 Tax=Natronolimnohabitans innermongolicus JCM 12255 TaxID=1227499 RepID=L9WLB9_9EURY|nr:hypothetical protein [Natronolimnohabitans innermongolicus]ELY50177.1 hypothetical protein C493_19461 [Natronolimnohabitans innermongolicus JCM 12255]